MTQYVEQFPIPDKNRKESKEIIALVKRLLNARSLDLKLKQQIDVLVDSIFR